MRTQISFAIIFATMLALVAFFWVQHTTAQSIVLNNNSDQNIIFAEITYAGQKLQLKNLAPHSATQKAILVKNDGSFAVHAVLASGTKISAERLGYITGSDGSENHFTITADQKLSFEQKY